VMKLDDLVLKMPGDDKSKPAPRPLPASDGTPHKWMKPIVYTVLAAFVFVVGMSIGDDAGERAAFDAEVAKQAAENRVGIITEERDSLETSVTVLETRIADMESDLASATQAADFYRMRSEDASSALAAIEEDMEALKREMTRIQQLKSQQADTPALKTASTGAWQSAFVSWYGPGFYGNTMAGGGTLTPDSMVVAHRSMDFGTKIEFRYNGRTCVAVVQDRGPFIAGRVFDLGPGTAQALGFSGVGTVEWRVV